jgi:hypothetical protein
VQGSSQGRKFEGLPARVEMSGEVNTLPIGVSTERKLSMREFANSLFAELAPVWMRQQEPRRGDEPPIPAPGDEPVPGDRPGKELEQEPEPIQPIDPDDQERLITPVPPVR